MTNFIFSLGLINKKLLLPLTYTILYLCINIYYIYVENNEVTLFIEYFGFAIGQISTFFVSNTIKYIRINKKEKKINIKNYIKDFFILYLIDILFIVYRLLPYHFYSDINSNELKEEKDLENKSSMKLFIIDGIEIIFITLITYFILKYKYYIHHIISIAIFVILCIIIDIILNNFKYTDTYTVISSILVVIADTFIYTYFKYLIANKYYYFLDILLYIGSFDFILCLLFFGIILIYQNMNNNNELIFQFFLFYKKNGIYNIIFRFLFIAIIKGFLVGIIEFIIINELTPNYIKIAYELANIPSTIIVIEDINRWILLVISIFQILSLLFYLEIFEYNFCNLNKNTKKSILEREHKDSIIEYNYDNDEIDIGGFDISESIKMQKNAEEMGNMSQKDDNSINK